MAWRAARGRPPRGRSEKPASTTSAVRSHAVARSFREKSKPHALCIGRRTLGHHKDAMSCRADKGGSQVVGGVGRVWTRCDALPAPPGVWTAPMCSSGRRGHTAGCTGKRIRHAPTTPTATRRADGRTRAGRSGTQGFRAHPVLARGLGVGEDPKPEERSPRPWPSRATTSATHGRRQRCNALPDWERGLMSRRAPGPAGPAGPRARPSARERTV